MAKIRYICDDNGHEFDGNDFSSECPTCGSTIRPISSGSGLEFISRTKEFVTNNKLVVGGISLILLLLLIFGNIDSCNKNIEYTISVNQNFSQNSNLKNPYLEVEISYKDEESKRTIKIEPNKVLSIIEDKVIINGSDSTYKIYPPNRIYLCAKDTADVIYFKFFNKPNYMLKDNTTNSSFHLIGISESPESECGSKLEPSDIAVNTEGENCNLIITINKKINGKKIFISVNGQYGDYKPNKFIWDRKLLINKKQDVWVYFERSDESKAIAAIGNGIIIPPAGCVPVNCEELKVEFIKLANAFGRNPLDRNPAGPQVLFQNFVKNKFTKTNIYLNDQLMDDMSDLLNTMRPIASNEGKHFKLQIEPIIIDECTTITFRFQEINED